MRKLKLYLDTTIISFFYADDAPEKRDIKIEFLNNFEKSYDVSISNFVIAELANTTDKDLREKLLNVVKDLNIKIIEIRDEDQDQIYLLANKYIEKGVIPYNVSEMVYPRKGWGGSKK